MRRSFAVLMSKRLRPKIKFQKRNPAFECFLLGVRSCCTYSTILYYTGRSYWYAAARKHYEYALICNLHTLSPFLVLRMVTRGHFTVGARG